MMPWKAVKFFRFHQVCEWFYSFIVLIGLIKSLENNSLVLKISRVNNFVTAYEVHIQILCNRHDSYSM